MEFMEKMFLVGLTITLVGLTGLNSTVGWFGLCVMLGAWGYGLGQRSKQNADKKPK